MRLDQYLYDNRLVPSRQRGQALIMAGLVYVNGEKAEKAGHRVDEAAQVEVREDNNAYVSRGGLKLEKALREFDLGCNGLVCMDVGASTGGFTDCMLQNGAAKVYAVDVGYGQLAWKLRCDERVVVMERTNVRNLTPESIPDGIEFFSVDVSFISLKLVLPVLKTLVGCHCKGVCLVKPQFEAGKGLVGKNGVVRDIHTHKEVLRYAVQYALESGFSVQGISYSPIKGPKGNIEFLMLVEQTDTPAAPEALEECIARVCLAAHQQLTQNPKGSAENSEASE